MSRKMKGLSRGIRGTTRVSVKTRRSSLPVLIRVDRKDDVLVAIFPTEPGTSDLNSMLCVEHIDGRTRSDVCSLDYIYEYTKTPTSIEIQKMLKILQLAGYRRLKVIKSMSAKYRRERLAKLNKRG